MRFTVNLYGEVRIMKIKVFCALIALLLVVGGVVYADNPILLDLPYEV